MTNVEKNYTYNLPYFDSNHIRDFEPSEKVEIVEELKKSYIDYAMSVIISRALPDLRDGLKPVQRRILYAMYNMNILPGTPYKKVARIVGDVIGKYHPHGDSSVTDALVRMGQDFNMRYPLIDGQGNFGSLDGDPAAAMRYIEARLSKIGLELLEGVDYTCDFISNYDGNELEPIILPAKFPNILINGSEGIAVGMATKIPPYNLTEISNGIVYMIQNGKLNRGNLDKNVDYSKDIQNLNDIKKLPKNRFPEFLTDINTDNLMHYIKAPDFPTGGEILWTNDIKNILDHGKGCITIRGVTKIEKLDGGKNCRIVITEIPYQVNKSSLVAKIVQLVKEKKLDGISDLRDESNKEGIRIVLEIKKDVNPQTIITKLYKLTEMQKNFSANIIVLHKGQPKVMGVRTILKNFIEFRIEINIRQKEHDLAKAKEREHILQGLMIAVNHIDEIIAIIKFSKDSEEAKNNLCKKYVLSEIQAQAILDMQLRRLAALEREKIDQEYHETVDKIREILELLNDDEKLLMLLIDQTKELSKKYEDDRRTAINMSDAKDIPLEETIPNTKTLITLSEKGYIKRVEFNNNKIQNRGGAGKKIATTKHEDFIKHILPCMTHDEIMFFSDFGKVYSIKAYEIPESSNTSKGIPIINLIKIDPSENITSILTKNTKGEVFDEDIKQEESESYIFNGITNNSKNNKFEYLLMATKLGMVKKTSILEFQNIRSNGLIAINLHEKDKLIWVKPTTGSQNVLLITKMAKSIHFSERDVKETGRSSQGVRGIKLKDGDEVISMDIVRPTENLILTISENGYGKVTNLSHFTIQKRGGSGILAAKINAKTGNLVIGRIIDHPNKELMIVSRFGQAIKINTNNLPLRNRQTSGVILIRLKNEDKVSAVAIV